jgi:hypothetical protein
MPVPLNEKLKVTEFAYRFWAPVSTKNSIGNAAIVLNKVRICDPHFLMFQVGTDCEIGRTYPSPP